MTAIVKGRVLDYAGRPIESTLTFERIGAPTAVSSETILTAGVSVPADCRGNLCAQLSAGEYRVRLFSGVNLTADVALNRGETYGLATLLGVTGDEGYSIIVSDDATTLTIPPSYLADESGERYELGSVEAYTVAGTDAQIERAIGGKVEEIAAAKIEELVAAEVEESAAPLIQSAVTEEVQPLRTAVTGLEGDVASLEGKHASDIARLEGEDASLEASIAGVAADTLRAASTATDARAAASGNASAITALTERVAAVEGREDKDTVYDDTALTARVKAVEDDVAGLEEDSTYWEESLQALRRDVTTLENREDKDTVYDDSALSGRVDVVETDVEVLEGRVATLEADGSGSGTSYDDTELRGRVEAVEDDIVTLDGRVGTHDTTLATLRTDLDSTTGVADDAARDASWASEQVASLSATVTGHGSRITAVESAATTLTGRVDGHDTDVATLRTDVTANTSATSSNTSRIGLLEQQMSTAVVSILMLEAGETIPTDTPAGTLVVRVSE